MRRRDLFALGATWVLCSWGCGSSSEGPELGHNEFGLTTCPEATDGFTCHTHRSIMGVSMGAHGAAYLGFSRPELFDTIGMLGVPMVDWVYMLRNIERGYLGGFCDYETLTQNIDRLDDPSGPAVCPPAPAEVKVTPDGRILEPVQSFNLWYRGVDEGRGGDFGRNKLRESFQDISLAFGNPSTYNPSSPYFPQGVPMDYRERTDEDRCSHPIVFEGLKEKRYNPDGLYPVITVCDTDTDTGDFDEAHPADRASEILLAVDYNRNGRRDYAEPVLFMGHEPFSDVGTSPGDTFDWDTNPNGTAGNGRYDEGEPFEDAGLDGVMGTGDYGEGNGKFDYNPNYAHFLETNPRGLLENLPEGQLERLNIWADAGIRDFLASAAATNWFWSSLVKRVGAQEAKTYDGFDAMKAPGSESYDWLKVDFSSANLGRHAYVRYGDPDASEAEIEAGDGQHVGRTTQALDRIFSAVAFAESRMTLRDTREVVQGEGTSQLQEGLTYPSEVLGEDREFALALPPGYFDPANADQRYPVVYLMHGQGQDSRALLGSAYVLVGVMASSADPEKQLKAQSDWTKFILVFPDSTCSNGACGSGTFNANHRGLDGNGPRYYDALLELMAYIDEHYRTAPPEVTPKDN